ncbi:MAG: FAD-dependent oxidoreductase, partial [Oscillospiraceae bacterium]|nr:FAD-dependent oxidoreductase [Oscillospiraceae bacterium]
MLRIQNIRLPIDYTNEDLRRAVGRKLHIPFEQIKEIRLRRRSVDARKRGAVTFLMTLDVRADGEQKLLHKLAKDKDIQAVTEKPYRVRICHSETRPVVIGFGPGGMFAAYVLAKAGLRPIVLERGCPVEERMQHVATFREHGVLMPESNVQFGEGGAGTFSDGKLNTGIKDARMRFVLETFVQCGA